MLPISSNLPTRPRHRRAGSDGSISDPRSNKGVFHGCYVNERQEQAPRPRLMNQAPAIRTLAALAIATALIFIVAWAYWPGLTGPFLLDDGVNLAPLGDNGGVHDWHRALSFINEGRSGTLHRSEEQTSEPQSLMRISYAVFCVQ